jgi:hypothetical protein
VAQDKTEGPSPVLTFLGIKIDTLAMEVRLPREKLQSLQSLLREWVEKHSCCRRELESLLGSLGHACCVAKEGKTFMRRLLELLVVATKPQHYISLNAAARSDLCWWQSFSAPLNHRLFRQGIEKDKQRFTFAMDASGFSRMQGYLAVQLDPAQVVGGSGRPEKGSGEGQHHVQGAATSGASSGCPGPLLERGGRVGSV